MKAHAADVYLLASHLEPQLGIEKAVIDLQGLIGGWRLVVIGESRPRKGVETLGSSLRGVGRILSMWRLLCWSRGRSGTVVAAGAWAALPMLAVKPKSLRVVVWEHSFSDQKIATSRSLRLLWAAARLLYRRADRIVCVSQDLSTSLQRGVGRDDVFVIPNVVGAVQRNPPARSLGPAVHLLTVGSLTSTKNHQLLLHSLASLPSRYTLRIAGDGPLRRKLESLADGLGLSERVSFLGFVEDTTSQYQWSTMLVQPSLGETFGLAMFEAAAMHRAVVATDYPLAREMIPHLVPGRCAFPDAASLSAAIEAVAANYPLETAFEAADERRRTQMSPAEIETRWRQVVEPDRAFQC